MACGQDNGTPRKKVDARAWASNTISCVLRRQASGTLPATHNGAYARPLSTRSMRSRASDANFTSLAAIASSPFSEFLPERSWDRLAQAAYLSSARCSTMPRISLSFMMSRSLPSILTSVPDHLPKRTRSY